MRALRMIAGVGLVVLYAGAWLVLALGGTYGGDIEDTL